MDIAANQIVGKLKSVCVLYDFVAVGHNSERFIVGAAHIGFITGDFADEFVIYWAGIDCPIQSGKAQCFMRGRGFLYHNSGIVPRLLSCVHHSFDIGRHNFILLFLFKIVF